MADGVTRRRQHAHAGRDLAVPIDELVARARKADQPRDGVARDVRGLSFGALHDDRHTPERAVLAAVVEMKVRVHDRPNVRGLEGGPAKRLADVTDAGTVVLVDPGVALADAGVNEHEPLRMADREREDDAVLPGQRVELRIGDVGEMDGDHVARLHGSASFARSSSVSSRSLAFAASKSRAMRSRVGSKPCDSSQYTTFDSPLIGPTSMRCSRPSTDAGTALYTRSASARSFLRSALMTAAACTPVPVRNASAPIAG